MGVVGFFGIADLTQILVGAFLDENIWFLVGGRPPSCCSSILPLIHPIPFLRGVESGRRNVPWVTNQEHHPALRKRFHQEWCSYGTIGFFYDEIVVGADGGVRGPG